MSMAPKRNPVSRVLMGVLGFQLLLGSLLIIGDLQDGFSLPRMGPKSPSLSEPVRPGDQTRRFSPNRAVPGSREPLPERLTLTVVSAGAAVLLEGEIAGGDAPRILKQIEELREAPTRAILNSPGGSVQDALELGRALRRGFRQGKTQGDPWQQGGVVVLSRDGQVLFRQVDKTGGDPLDLDGVVAAVRGAR